MRSFRTHQLLFASQIFLFGSQESGTSSGKIGTGKPAVHQRNDRMRHHWLPLTALLASMLAALASATAQQQQAPPLTLRLETRIVLLDVAVTDNDGRPVTDLKQDDFRIFERNIPQRILSFEPPAAHQLSPDTLGKPVVESTADLPRIGRAPVTILVLDEINMTSGDQRYAQDKLIAWLTRQPPVLPQPTSLIAVTYKDVHLLRDYTQGRDELLQILRHHFAGVLWRGGNSGSLGGQASDNLFATLGAVEQIANTSRGIPGRKNLLWIGDGFPDVSSADLGSTTAKAVQSALRHVSSSLLHAHITLDIIGPTLKSDGPSIIETQSQALTGPNNFTLSLEQGDLPFSGLAAPTGGHAYGNRNDLDHEIARAVDEGRTYYTLSYSPTDSSTDAHQFRKIRVDLTRPGLRLQTRDGYFEEPSAGARSAKPDTQQLGFDLFGAAFSAIPYTGLHLAATHDPDGHPGDWILQANAGDLTWQDQPDGHTREAETVVLAACLGPDGKLLRKTFASLKSNTTVAGPLLPTLSAPLRIHVDAPSGTARIRFVVRDTISGRIGTADSKP